MSILKKVKAFLGFSLILLSLNAFAFTEYGYLERVFNNNKKVNLLADDIQILNAKKYLKLNKDQLSNRILLSDIFQKKNPYSFVDFSNRINYYTLLSNHNALANIYQTLAFSKTLDNDWDVAITCFLKALDEFKLLDDYEEIVFTSQNLSWLYYVNGDLDNSLLFNKNAVSLLSHSPNQSTLFGFLIWQNEILLAQGKALEVENNILKRVLIMASRNNKKIQEWACFYQLGKSYLLQNKLVQAKWFFIQSLTLSENFSSKTPKLKSLLMLAKAKRRSNDNSLAIQNLRTAQGLIQNSNKIYQIDISKQFAEVYHALDDKIKENQYISAYNRLRNTALNN